MVVWLQKKRQKWQNKQKKFNMLGRGVEYRWDTCGIVSNGCCNDNVVLKHYCYYLLNHLSNKKKSERTSTERHVLGCISHGCCIKTTRDADLRFLIQYTLHKNMYKNDVKTVTGFPFSQVTWNESVWECLYFWAWGAIEDGWHFFGCEELANVCCTLALKQLLFTHTQKI